MSDKTLRTPKPIRAWATTTIGGSQIIPDTVRWTKREAIKAHCEGNDTTWEEWKRGGCRVLKVTIAPRGEG